MSAFCAQILPNLKLIYMFIYVYIYYMFLKSIPNFILGQAYVRYFS